MHDGHCYRIPTSRKRMPDSQTFCRTQRKMTDKLPIHVDNLKFPALLRSLDAHYGLCAEDGTLQKNFW